jgi:hypothetical protein
MITQNDASVQRILTIIRCFLGSSPEAPLKSFEEIYYREWENGAHTAYTINHDSQCASRRPGTNIHEMEMRQPGLQYHKLNLGKRHI